MFLGLKPSCGTSGSSVLNSLLQNVTTIHFRSLDKVIQQIKVIYSIEFVQKFIHWIKIYAVNIAMQTSTTSKLSKLKKLTGSCKDIRKLKHERQNRRRRPNEGLCCTCISSEA